MQQQLRLIGEHGDIGRLSDAEMNLCHDPSDALQMTWHRRTRRHSLQDMAHKIGMDKGNLSRSLNGDITQVFRQLIKFERECGVIGVTQFLANQHGYILVPKRLVG